MSPPSWTCLLPLTLSHPSRLLQSPSLSSESYSKFPLGLYFTYGSVHVSMLLSPLFPPSPSYSPCPEVCSLCLGLHCCPANRFISTIFLDSTYMCVNMWYLFFSFWPTSLCIIDSRFTYLIRTDFDVFLFPTTYPQCGAFFLGGSFESSFSAPSDLTAHYLNHLQLRVGRPLHFWVVVLK